MDYQAIINQYYPEENKLKHILLVHSHSVADKALAIVDQHPELHINRQFVEEAAMLHDIGIFKCNAPGIQCFGNAPYIQHGRIGAELLRNEGYPQHARVCERHTGSRTYQKRDNRARTSITTTRLSPETTEEKLICYADKFFSKLI